MSKKNGCPDRIWLQACDECYPGRWLEIDYEITWCVDPVGHEHDVGFAEDTEYVRLSRLEEVMQSLIKRIERIDEWKNINEGYFVGLYEGYQRAIDLIYEQFPELGKEKK